MKRNRDQWMQPSVLVLLAALCTVADGPLKAAEQLPEGAQVDRVVAQPESIELANPFAYTQLLLTAQLKDGQHVDVTRLAKVEAGSEWVKVSDAGLVRPVADGDGQLKLSVAGQEVIVPVQVRGQSVPYSVSFVRDVMPTMSKIGCNAGTCHGSQKGKNGFKLSLRGYDPLFDHRALVDDLAGRRVNRAAPDQSLFLLKTSGQLPHGGGVLTHPGEPSYELFKSWVAEGMQLDLDSPRVTGIEIFPKDPVVPLPEMTQQMRVVATYSDGSHRDVTAQAHVESNLTDIAEVDKHGLVSTLRRGEAAILARYEGNYTATTLVVMGDRSGFEWKFVPQYNYVDTLVYEKLERMKILPSDVCSDAEFLRRIYLDLTGLPPEPDQIRAFMVDKRDGRVKREEVVDKLVGSAEYVEFWTNKWADLLQVNRKFLTEKGAWALRNWIREAIARNMPYNRFVNTILTANGSTYENPPAAYLRVLRGPDEAMENTTQLFLGIRFNCNKCHDHPFERWTQGQYYDLAAYFARVGRKDGPQPGDEVIYNTVSGEVNNPKTGQVVTPAFPYDHPDELDPKANRREQLAHWVTSPENQYFAKSLVNRMWSYLLGAGLIEPVDDIRAGNPPTNPKLLDRLTDDFVASGFDVQHIVRTICKSRVYQHSVETNKFNADDEINYSHALARRLSAETLYDAIHRATGSVAKLPGLPAGYRAVELPDSNVEVGGGFLDLFGRPPRESACECERSSGMMLAPVLKLINGPIIADAIADPNNRITKLVAEQSDNAKLVEEIFLAILCRPPTDDESAEGVDAIASAETRLSGAQDLAWALLNSSSFLFNH